MNRLLFLLPLLLSCLLRAEDIGENERAAAAACMSYAEAQEIYRRTDWDGNAVLEYAQSMLGGLRARTPPLDLDTLPVPGRAEQAEITALIAALGADEFSVRETAHQKLASIGMKAYKQINAAIRTADDVERRDRCARLTLQIREALAPPQQPAQRWGLFTSGKDDGAEGDTALIDAALARAECPAGVDRKLCTPMKGYFFRVLTAQGDDATGGKRSYIANSRMTLGYALVAFPSEYGKTGRNVFMINNNGTTFTRDFGSAEATEKMIESCTEFNPGKDWKAAE